MLEVRYVFMPTDAQVLQIMPPAAEYVNDTEHVLHLWARVDDGGRLTPDFRRLHPSTNQPTI